MMSIISRSGRKGMNCYNVSKADDEPVRIEHHDMKFEARMGGR
jgi:hypothetical protein